MRFYDAHVGAFLDDTWRDIWAVDHLMPWWFRLEIRARWVIDRLAAAVERRLEGR